MAEAATIGILRVLLSAETAQFEAGLKQAQGHVAGFAKGLAGMGQQASQLGSALTKTLSVPILGIGVSAAKMSVDLNASMANVAALIPGNTARINELKTAVQATGVALGKTTGDMSAGLYELISTLGDSGDTAKLLEINAKAAGAGLASVAQAIGLTTAVTRTFGDSSAEATQKVSDLAFQAVNLGKTTFPELAASIGRVAPLAKETGVSLEEMFAILATATGVTGDTAEVTTQMAAAITSIVSPTKDLEDVYKRLGIQSGETLIRQQGLVGAMQEVARGAELAGKPIIDLVGRKEAWILTSSLAGSQASTFAKRLDDMRNAAGATDTAFKAQTEGINKAGFAWSQMTVRLQVAAQQLGDVLIPHLLRAGAAFEPVFTAGLKLASAFGALPQPVQTAGLGFLALAAATGPVSFAFGQLASTGALLMKQFTSKGLAMRALTALLPGLTTATVAQSAATTAHAAATATATTATGLLAASARALAAAWWPVAAAVTAVWAAWKIGNTDAVRQSVAEWALASDNLTAALYRQVMGFKQMTAAEAQAAVAATEAAGAAQKSAEGLETTAQAAERLRKQISGAGLQSDMQALQASMVALGKAGELTPDAMKRIADAAKALQAQHVTLTPELARVVQLYGQIAEAGPKAGQGTADLARELAATRKEVSALSAEQRRQIQAGDALGHSAKDIAEATKVSEAAVKMYLDRVKEATDADQKATEAKEAFRASVQRLTREFVPLKATLVDTETQLLVTGASIHNLASGDLPDMLSSMAAAGQEARDWAQTMGATLAPAMHGFSGTLNESKDTVVSWRNTVKSALQDIPGILQRAFEGGGNLLGAAKSLGVQIADSLLGPVLKGLSPGQQKGLAAGLGIGAAGAAAIGQAAGGNTAAQIASIASGLGGAALAATGWGTAMAGAGVAGTVALGAATLGIGAAAVGVVMLVKHFTSLSKEVKEVREDVSTFTEAVRDNLTEAQRAEAGGQEWAETLIGIRDAFIATGRSAQEAEALTRQMWDTNNPKAARQAIALIGQAFEDLARQQRAAGGVFDELFGGGATTSPGLQNILDMLARIGVGAADAQQMVGTVLSASNDVFADLFAVATETGSGLPAALQPMIDRLAELGVVSDDTASRLGKIGGENDVDFKKMAETAKKFGIELGALGPKFQGARLAADATEIWRGFQLLTKGGTDFGTVVFGMREEISKLVQDSVKFGTEIPENMRPMIEDLQKSGNLVDANGNKMTDLSGLKFGPPIEDQWKRIGDKLSELIDKIGRLLPAALNAIPEGTVRIREEYIPDPDRPDGSDPEVSIPSPDTPERAAGSLGATGRFFEDFGRESLVKLHGTEAVVRPDQASMFALHTLGSLNLNAMSSSLSPGRSGGISQQQATAARPVSGDTYVINMDNRESFFDTPGGQSRFAQKVANAIEHVRGNKRTTLGVAGA